MLSDEAAAETKAIDSPSQVEELDAEEDDKVAQPSQLLSRTQSIQDKDGIRDSSEAMAHNVLESFGAALIWRAKTWMKSLANVLALKEQKRVDAPQGDSGTLADQDSGKENEDLMNSKEMQIIDAIVKSSEEVTVVNIKTAFRVLPNRVSRQNSNDMSIHDVQEPASKKAKTASSETPQGQVNDGFKVTHKILFEATISMTSNDGVRYNGVKLEAPGYIQGTFAKGIKAEDETLTGISMTLDTDALALSLERQSRLVVRRAAEAALMAASGIDCTSSPKYLESPHVHHSIISPRYVLMSPMPAVYPIRNVSNETLPPIPSRSVLNGQGHTRVVSSSEGSSGSESSAHTTPEARAAVPPPGPSFPALLSVANEELTRGD